MAVRNNPAFTCVALAVLAAACSSGDDDAAPVTTEVMTTATEIERAPVTSATPGPGVLTTLPPGSAASTSAPTPSVAPDTGVPGLDSDDSFCAAWSRFGGSWQVLVQAGAAGDPAQLARLEVVASTVAGAAYDDVFAVWPTALESERDVVADDYFGAFQRRSADAAQSLADAGAGDDDIAMLGAAWSTALAQYDPSAGTIAVDVPADLEPLVDEAATSFAGKRVPLPSDPSMVITAETPLTDQFLATACPDQGWIVGQDVVDTASSDGI